MQKGGSTRGRKTEAREKRIGWLPMNEGGRRWREAKAGWDPEFGVGETGGKIDVLRWPILTRGT